MGQTESSIDTVRPASLPVRILLGVVLAAAANALVVVATGAAGVAPDFRALTLPPVVFLSVVGVLGGAVVYSQLQRVTDDRDRLFRRIAVVVLLLSFLPDVALLVVDEAATVEGVAVLMAMHVVVAAVAVGVFTGVGSGDR